MYVYVVNNEITNSTDGLNYAETSESTTLIANMQEFKLHLLSLYLSKIHIYRLFWITFCVSKLLNLNFSAEVTFFDWTIPTLYCTLISKLKKHQIVLHSHFKCKYPLPSINWYHILKLSGAYSVRLRFTHKQFCAEKLNGKWEHIHMTQPIHTIHSLSIKCCKSPFIAIQLILDFQRLSNLVRCHPFQSISENQ